jgi:DNA-binding NarL/FixJ family response regulator
MRIFIIDGQTVFREGLKSILSAFPDIEVVGEATSAEVAFPIIHAARP